MSCIDGYYTVRIYFETNNEYNIGFRYLDLMKIKRRLRQMVQVAIQLQFLKDVNSLVLTINDHGNPFTDDSSDLYVINTKDVKGKDVAKSITVIEDIGTHQFRTYYDQRLSKCTNAVTEIIHRNNLSLFSTKAGPKKKSNQKEKVKSLKEDVALFSRLFISFQARESDLDDFFSHENQAAPPSLSLMGKL